MNEFNLFKIVEIATCYIVHCELHYFVQCHAILGADNNSKLPLNMNISHTIISVFKTS